jgi:hypothetical protein
MYVSTGPMIFDRRSLDMSMQALNQLVARSIIDPTILKTYASGQIESVLAELHFSPTLRKNLSSLQAENFAEFSLLAYRVVKASEEAIQRVELPSPAEGLLSDHESSDREQVA